MLPRAVTTTIELLSRLPGVGTKMASRIALHLIERSPQDGVRLGAALEAMRASVHACPSCGFLTDEAKCFFCSSERDQQVFCVVEGPLDVLAIEQSGGFRGLFHVLGGALSPLDGIGPDQLRIRLLRERVEAALESGPTEIIIATNPSLEGEATAAFLGEVFEDLRAKDVTITRLARGLPMGSDVEYADPATLQRALEGRRQVDSQL